MSDSISIHNTYQILAPSSVADDRTRVLKHGDTFAIFDHYGDILPTGLGEEGLFHEGTRFLSRLALTFEHTRPLLLNSTVNQENAVLMVDLMNPDLTVAGMMTVPHGTLHFARTTFLWEGTCYERLTIRNYGLAPVSLSFAMLFEADYADIFEVRGTKRERHGYHREPVVEDGAVMLAYQGLDGIIRCTRITFAPAPHHLSATSAIVDLTLPPQDEYVLTIKVTCIIGESSAAPLPFGSALSRATSALSEVTAQECHVTTDNQDYNALLLRSAVDLHMLTTVTPHGPYPYAGVPWFSTPFGRDGIITALQYLWVNPKLARGVLTFLAATQAKQAIPEQDAEPGKILHETRRGEMAALGEVPFGRYYGSIDATPLFIMLAGAYYQRTGDRALIEEIWPAIDLALTWIDEYGDRDGDGFVEYSRATSTGLEQQGWKDSHDSVFHADGRIAHGPIALCEVQGYVFAAKRAAADLIAMLGDPQRAAGLRQASQILQERFTSAFWCDDLSMYALALDGEKRPCRVRTSNAGHCLFTGIARPDHAEQVAQALMADDMFSGWGVRTLSGREVRYNPMSYHNGSVWPHDTAIVAAGLARYGFRDQINRILVGLADASLFIDLHRLPELFCGFARRPGDGPTLYPVACAPQAWAAGSIFMLLQACLGLSLTTNPNRITLVRPSLPDALDEVVLTNLSVGHASLDLALHRHGDDVGTAIMRREGTVEIAILK